MTKNLIPLAPLALLAAAQSVSAAAPPADADPRLKAQVESISGKLADWRGAWGSFQTKLACRTTRSTGDVEIDKIGCAATLACIKPIYPELKTIADSKAAEADKKKRMGAKLAGMDTCLKQHRGEGIAALALARSKK